jgi:hypothetical protein
LSSKKGELETKGKLLDVCIDARTAADVSKQKASITNKVIQVIASMECKKNSPSTTFRAMSSSVSRSETAPPPVPSGTAGADHGASSSSVTRPNMDSKAEATASPTPTPGPVDAASPSSVSNQKSPLSLSSVNIPPKISEDEAKKLIEKIKPILEKYSK